MNDTCYTPSAINKYIKAILDNDNYLKVLKIKGELSNVKYHSNGNMYFNIKDEHAHINCIKFSSFNKSEEKFLEGDSVEIEGSLYLYVKNGTYNINVKTMKKHGVGDLLIKFNELKIKLQNEGLFDLNHKKEIPKFPKKIGVLTAKTGAAVQDILITLEKRYPLTKVTVYSTLVQGNNSANDIVKNIKYADNDNNDVLIVGRGGGSIEDLWSFNEEIVAHAIYNCNTPIISSVGHETDFTIADLVADVRAATPTAAAQIATPEVSVIKEQIYTMSNGLSSSLKMKIKHEKLKVNSLVENQYFKNPLTYINLKYDITTNKFDKKILLHKEKVNTYINNVNRFSRHLIANENMLLKSSNLKVENLHNQLDNLNPLSILSRGYLTATKNNKTISSINEIEINDRLEINMTDGKLITNVINKEQNAK